MRLILTTLFILILTASAKAQTPVFTFECFSNANMTGDSCDICVGTSFQSRSFSGLMVYRLGVFNKWIDEPYLIRLRPGNSVEFIEQTGTNPDKITIPLSQTGYATVTGFIDSTFCAGAQVQYSFSVSDSLRTTAINYLDTLTFVGRGGSTVFFDTVLQKVVITSSGATSSTNLSFSGTSSPVTLNSSTGTDVTLTAGNGISLAATSTNTTITAADISPTNEAQTLTGGTNSITLSAAGGAGGGTVTVDTNPEDDVTGSGANGRVAFWTGTSTISSNSNFFWNNARNRLQLGTVLDNGRVNIEMLGQPGIDTSLYFTSSGGWGVRWIGAYNNTSTERRGFHIGGYGFSNVLNVDIGGFGGVAVNKPYNDGIDYSFEVARATDHDGIVVSRQGAESTNAMFHVNSEGDGLLRARSGNWTLGDMDISAASQNPTATLHLFKPQGIAENDIFVTEKSAGYGRTIMSQFFTASNEYGTSWRNGDNGRYLTMMSVGATQRVGINTYTPAQTFHVAGAARITGSAGTPTALMGRDANGDISNLALSGLSISSGTLSVTSASKWTTGTGGIYNTDLNNVSVGATAVNLSRFRVSGNSANTCARFDAGALPDFGAVTQLTGSGGTIYGNNYSLNATGNATYLFANSNAGTNANSLIQFQSNGGSPFAQYQLTNGSGASYSTGIDNSAIGDPFKIKSGANLNGLEGITMLSNGFTGINDDAPNTTLDVEGTDGIDIPNGTTAQRPTGGQIVRFNSSFGGFEALSNSNNVWYRVSSTTSPTASWNSGVIGSGGSVSFATGSNEVAGTIILTTGTAPTGTNVSAISITFPNAYNGGVTPFPIICQANAITATEWNKFHVGTSNSTLFQIGVAAQLAASTTYRINYRITQ